MLACVFVVFQRSRQYFMKRFFLSTLLVCVNVSIVSIAALFSHSPLVSFLSNTISQCSYACHQSSILLYLYVYRWGGELLPPRLHSSSMPAMCTLVAAIYIHFLWVFKIQHLFWLAQSLPIEAFHFFLLYILNERANMCVCGSNRVLFSICCRVHFMYNRDSTKSSEAPAIYSQFGSLIVCNILAVLQAICW